MLNPFIADNNLCAVDGDNYLFFRLVDGSTGGFYEVFHKLGTPVIYTFSTRTRNGKLIENTITDSGKSPHLKAFGLIRDKYSESTRPLVPIRYHKEEYFKQLKDLPNDKMQPFFDANRLLCSLMSTNRTLAMVIEMLSTRGLTDDNVFALIRTNVGDAPLEDTFAYRVIKDEHIGETIVKIREADLVYFVEDATDREQSLFHKGKLILTKKAGSPDACAFVSRKGLFYVDDRRRLVSFDGGSMFSITESEWHNASKEAIFAFREANFVLPTGDSERRPIEDKQNQPKAALTTMATFIAPTTCKKIDALILRDGDKKANLAGIIGSRRLAKGSGFYVQPKLDGNRVCVFIEGTSIGYFSRSGKKLPVKFNNAFDDDIRRLQQAIASGRALDGKLALFEGSSATLEEGRKLFVDCECYKHGLTLQQITGPCNRDNDDNDFAQLNLHVLSYAIGQMSFKETMGILAGIDAKSFKRIQINASKWVSTVGDAEAYMDAAIANGYEGIVLYPENEHYEFGKERLYKVKAVSDGECYPIGFIASPADPDAIGSVRVRAKRYLDNEGDDYIEFAVSAALTKDLRVDSMHNDDFDRALGKPYTIVCDAFSDDGIPLRARFKQPFTPDSWRRDLEPVPAPSTVPTPPAVAPTPSVHAGPHVNDTQSDDVTDTEDEESDYESADEEETTENGNRDEEEEEEATAGDDTDGNEEEEMYDDSDRDDDSEDDGDPGEKVVRDA